MSNQVQWTKSQWAQAVANDLALFAVGATGETCSEVKLKRYEVAAAMPDLLAVSLLAFIGQVIQGRNPADAFHATIWPEESLTGIPPAPPPRDWFADVYEFHDVFQRTRNPLPTVPDFETIELRKRIMDEELNETIEAMGNHDIPGIADGLADLIYVAIGTAVSYGIDLRPVWNAVHAANLAKVGGPVREDGKVGKPPGWTPPDVAGILASQAPIPEAK